jgi:hypothetical protein
MDFDLFHKLKEHMRENCFSSLEEISAAVTQAIQGLNKSGTLNGIANVGTPSMRSRRTTYKDCKEILPKIKYSVAQKERMFFK